VKKLIFIVPFLFGILVSYNCKKEKKAQSEQLYVKSLLGIKLSNSEIIPFGASVQLKKSAIETEEFAKVEYLGKEYDISPKYLSESVPHWYFMVSTPKGLNFREGAGKDFKRIDTLPKGTSGEVKEIKPEIVEIQKKNGFWFSTEINGKVGWLFSGFVILSEKYEWEEETSNSSEKDFKFEIVKKSINEGDETPALSKLIPQESYTFANYKIDFLVDKNANEFENSCGFDKSIRISGNSKDIHISSGAFTFDNPQTAKNGFLFYDANGCGCCCSPSANYLVVTSKDSIRRIMFMSNGKIGGCDTLDQQLSVSIGTEFKLDTTNSILYLKSVIPICNEESKIVDHPVYERLGSEYYFHVYSNKDGVFSEKVQKLEKDEIPSEYLTEWNKALAL
jgi:hypothetical protein